MNRSLSRAASAAGIAPGPRPTSQVGRALRAALLLVMTPVIAMAQSGTSDAPARIGPFANHAVVTYLYSNGTPDSSLAEATVSVMRQAGVALTGPFATQASPGDRRAFAHAVTNRGNEADVLQLTGSAPAGWTLSFYRDADGDGQLSAPDVRITAGLPLAPGSSAAVLAVYDVPADAIDGSVATLGMTVTSTADPRATVATTDRVSVVIRPLPRPSLALVKLVDKAEATIGDTLAYTIRYTNTGDGDAIVATLADTLPSGTRYVAGSLALNGVSLSDAADADAGVVTTLANGRAVVGLLAGLVAPGATGTVTLRVTIAPTALDGALANVVTMSYANGANTIALTSAATAVTRIATAVVTISEQIVGATRVIVGNTVHLRISYANTSATDAINTIVRDSLPDALAFVSSAGGSASGSVVTWSLGTLRANTAGVVDLYTRIVARPAGDSLADRASISADNATTRRAQAALVVTPFNGHDIVITKTAAVLDAAIGDAIPYVVTVQNTSSATLHGVIVRDLLPEGMRYSPASTAGMDSVSVNGTTLGFHLTAPLAAGATATVRYAAVVANPKAGADLRNRAVAEAENGLVQSDTAVAVVTQRRAFAMRERTMIGKVWLDRNDDGIQQPGEEGVAGAQVWDANGEVVLTDKEGRFSFRNVATGTHALRLDPLGMPKDFVLPSRADEVVMVQADGWTMPRTSIRLVPRAGATVASSCACATAAAATSALTVANVTATDSIVPVAPSVAVAAVTVAPMLSPAERKAQARQELVGGATAHFFEPADGIVLATTRFYAGVKGPAGATIRLFDGKTLLREGMLRGDGSQDFVNVELAAGPHHLRVVTVDAAAGDRADSIMVHVSGAPARFALPADQPVLRGDAPLAVPVRVRVLDTWGVPVVGSPLITVDAKGATIDAADADASSVGLQLRPDAGGWLTVPLRAGHDVGAGELRLTSTAAKGMLPLRIFASVRSLIALGVGQVGVGAAPGAFGALTVQGAISEQTSVTVSYDSRRTDNANAFFQQGYDPLGEDRFPTFGDNSQSRFVAPSSKALSARVEHGTDWIAAGDVQTQGFGRDGELGAYRRAVTGASGQLTTGALTWHGFGSMTHQALERRQLRGEGSTGPYLVGADIRAGTEQIAIEVRARENAARVIVRQELVRTTDYQIDYATGVVLLRLPIPAADPTGNPVFLVATVERSSGGAAHFVGGARLDADAARLLGLGAGVVDTLSIGLSGIRDGASGSSLTAAGTNILNADFRLRRGAFSLGGGVLRAQSPDSVGVAMSATTRWALADDKFALDGRWMQVGEGLGAADPRLASALDEVSVGISALVPGAGKVRLHHDRTHFAQYGVDRSTSGVSAEQTIAGRKISQDIGLVSESMASAGGGAATALTARVNTALTDRLETWVDASRSLATPTSLVATARPNQVGTGFTLRLPAGLKLDASHRITSSADSVASSVTSAQLRAEGFLGGQVWTGFEESSTGLNDEVRASHSALFGWNQRVGLGAGWQLTSMFERRIGLSHASVLDPARALPFAQPEVDRWSAAAGLGWNPTGDRARVAMNGEMQNAVGSRGTRFQLTGDAALNAGMALITLHDWSSRHDASRTDGLGDRRDDRSLLGLAIRPVTSERFNALAKMEWRRTLNPIGDVLLASNSRDQRLIGTTDAVWAPMRNLEVSARYALRFSTMDVAGDSGQRVTLADHFAGARVERKLARGISARLDGRLLRETNSGISLWNAAPSAVYDFQGRLQLEAGYRFGELRDADFANVGGPGAFATIGFRFTEQSLSNPAAFWRARLLNDK